MKVTKYIFIGLVIFLFVYVFFINALFNTNFQDFINSNFSNNEDKYYISGSEERLNMGDSVSVQITKNRWYGTIYEENNKEILYLFDFIPLPLEKGDSNYLQAHLIFSGFWLFILIITIISHFILKEDVKN